MTAALRRAQKRYREKHKELLVIRGKEYRKKNKEQIKTRMKMYRESENGKIVKATGHWRRQGYGKFISLDNYLKVVKIDDKRLKLSIMVRLGKGLIDERDAMREIEDFHFIKV